MDNDAELTVGAFTFEAMSSLDEALSGLKLLAGPEASDEVSRLERALDELRSWRTLTRPDVLHVSLLRGVPARLSKASLLHLVGAGRCSNLGYCCMEKGESS
jgi:hypothetical protein